MTTTIDLTWYPDPAYAGGGVFIIATLTPTPVAGAHVWISVDGLNSGGQLNTDSNGQASTYVAAMTLGSHVVGADFVTVAANPDDEVETGSVDPTPHLIVVTAPPTTSPASPGPGATTDFGLFELQNPAPATVDDRAEIGSSAFSGASDIDPYTGASRSDPYTGEPLSARDAAISDRVKAVYSQPDAVPEATRNAVFDFYRSPAIDLTGVPQSVQNSILDVFSRPLEPPLPGRGLDEF